MELRSGARGDKVDGIQRLEPNVLFVWGTHVCVFFSFKLSECGAGSEWSDGGWSNLSLFIT